MNLLDHGVLPAAVAWLAWLVRGRYEKDSAIVKQAHGVLEMYAKTSARQDEQLEALRGHVERLEGKIVELEATISKLTAENAALRSNSKGTTTSTWC